MNIPDNQEPKFERDEIERRLKSALYFALEDMGFDPDLGVRTDGPFAVLNQFSADGDPIHQFEIRFDIQGVSDGQQ